MILYLVRHAQSLPMKAQHFSEWPLSPVGARQAEQLTDLLSPLGIAQVFSSPFARSLQTAEPFARKHALQIAVMDDLRERHITNEGGLPSDEIWRRSWEDFSFCMDGCETSLAAQARIGSAIRDIAQRASGTAAIFTHGNVIGLFLNALTSAAGRAEAETLRNPDVRKVRWEGGAFTWERHFRLPGLERIATNHSQTPTEEASA